MGLKLRIINETINIFRERGVKFTMDELASSLGISKRTLYEAVKSKEDVLNMVLDGVFNEIYEEKKLILEDDKLNHIEKLKKVLIVLPNSYNTLEYTRLYEVKKVYPEIYIRLSDRLESDWEPINKLILEGMEKGIIRKVNLHTIRSILIGSIKEFLEYDYLYTENKDYKEALTEVIDVMFNGLIIK